MKLDLNCDLGEGEPLARTQALMQHITSASVACGGHAGDLHSMEACVRLAKEFGVRLGAHPGPWIRRNLGRGKIELTATGLELLILQQVGALEQIARAHGVKLHHIKLHGALYHATERSEALARGYVLAVAHRWPRARIYALSGGRVAHVAHRAGVPVWEEIFADRGYRDDGTLVPRGKPGALVTQPRAAAARLRTFLKGHRLESVSGALLRLRAHTVCVHADTPDATAIARAVARVIGA